MTKHSAFPPTVSWPWLAVAAAVWILAAVIVPDPVPDPIPAGRVESGGVLITDVIEGRYGHWALVATGEGTLLIDLARDFDLAMGHRVVFEGSADGEAGTARGVHHRSRVKVRTLTLEPGGAAVPLRVGTAVRDHVMRNLEPFDDGRALLAGFLIGDTSELDRSDVEAMRLSGLSHFVAVSGSNVALFLILLALATGPLSMEPRRRALIGLVGLPIYAAATRFEPSVLRASVMAGLALVGRLVGVVFEAWQLLSLAVVALVVSDPAITGNVGFQLSVAATAGVLVGARWPTNGGKVHRALAVTCGAQVSVAPLLLFHFGAIPLFSPLTNLVASPLVAASTVLGAVGVAGVGPVVDLSAHLAGAVLTISRSAATLPQLTVVPAIALGLVGAVGLMWRGSRSWIAVGVSSLVVVLIFSSGSPLPDPGVVVLDVGQGDSILVHGGGGRFALVDGGPDPAVLLGKMRQYGVRSLELVILSHVHADHVSGLTGLFGRIPIGEIWAASQPHETASSREFFTRAEQWGVPVHRPNVGETRVLGTLALRVDGPLRRYASPNDQSIVLTVEGPRHSILLSGDIEVIAQQELSHLKADILKVPHQGAATSDPDWLVSVGAREAIVSVGPNQFGHPAPWVIDLFRSTGAVVFRTDLDGDVSVGL